MAPLSSLPSSSAGHLASPVVSSFCTGHGCVGVAIETDEIRVVDTKSADAPALRFTAAEWAAFVAGVKAGEFDLPGAP